MGRIYPNSRELAKLLIHSVSQEMRAFNLAAENRDSWILLTAK